MLSKEDPVTPCISLCNHPPGPRLEQIELAELALGGAAAAAGGQCSQNHTTFSKHSYLPLYWQSYGKRSVV